MMLAASTVGFAGTPSLSATEFDPETDHDELTSGPSIHDADGASPPSDDVRDAFAAAAADGHYEGTIENASDRYTFLGDERYEFVRFEGTFYEFAADIDGDRVVIDAEERDPQSIADELAVDFADAPDPIQETIETGEPVELTGDTPGRMIVVDDGTYYVVTLGPPHHGSSGVGLTFLAGVAILGGGLLIVGIGVVGGLWLRRRRRGT
ncbi:hypothetical protein FYC77_07980 [Natrialba swarupiae]|uniref:Uncharacterized protein n=2 Tax=Natrialba swarupiae TaxID=2448032 RepID=A0A5D5ANR6_9EURY|nr:hypothetical protein FYC77_07980 [Natrialba swarupiae]